MWEQTNQNLDTQYAVWFSIKISVSEEQKHHNVRLLLLLSWISHLHRKLKLS